MKKHLFMLLGHPGSGKTYFSEQLATEIGAVRLNADAMRIAAFGTLDKAKEFDKGTGLLNEITFNALDYASAQILGSGQSVICDYQHNEKSFRKKRTAIADEKDALAVIIWIKTPSDLAVRRGSERKERLDSRTHSNEKMGILVDKYSKLLEQPDGNERTIIIDGTLPFEKQYEQFNQQIHNL